MLSRQTALIRKVLLVIVQPFLDVVHNVAIIIVHRLAHNIAILVVQRPIPEGCLPVTLSRKVCIKARVSPIK